MIKYLILLSLCACSAPKYKDGDCVVTKINGDIAVIVEVRSYRYIFCYPPDCDHKYIIKHEYFENGTELVSCGVTNEKL
jgi:nitrite reductase/ring-hydroxylating ferredoxin subunit